MQEKDNQQKFLSTKYSANESRRAAAIFLIITFVLSSIFYFLIIHTGKLGSGFGIYVTGLMWCPGMSALITTQILKRKVSSLGWQWGKPKYQLWSYIVPIAYALIAYILIWLNGWGEFYNKDFVDQISASFGWNQLPKGFVIGFYIVLMGTCR